MEKKSDDEAVARLEEIVRRLESGEVSLEEVGGSLKEAAGLIELCREELKGYKEKFESLLFEVTKKV